MRTKRLVALILSLILLCALCNTAFAYEEHATVLMKNLDHCKTSSEMVSTKVNREITVALMLLEHWMHSDADDLWKIVNGVAYVCRYGNYTVDAYIPLSEGGYMNEFYGTVTGALQCYGYTYSAPTSTSDYYYYEVDMEQVWEYASSFIAILAGDSN